MAAPKDKSADSAPGEFSLGWTVLLAALLGVTCGASPIPFNLIAFTVEPLGAEFGWSRTEIIFRATIYGSFGFIIGGALLFLLGRYPDNFDVAPKPSSDALPSLA